MWVSEKGCSLMDSTVRSKSRISRRSRSSEDWKPRLLESAGTRLGALIITHPQPAALATVWTQLLPRISQFHLESGWQALLPCTAYQVTFAPSLGDFVLAGDQDREANATVTGRLRSQGLGSASCRHCGGTVGKQRIDEVGHSLCC